MQRDILFRGKRVDNGEWIFGDIYTGLNDETYINVVIEQTANSWCNKQIIIQKETVGQFTGLTDSNGTKIFDGDVCTVKSIHNFYSDLLEEYREEKGLQSINGIGDHFTGVMRIDFLRGLMFENLKTGFSLPVFTRTRYIKINYAGIEVTGNIHDNGTAK